MIGNRLREWAIVPLRIIVGLGFVVHGYAKWSHGPANFAKLLQQIHVPLPLATAWVVTGLELVGGLALIVGIGVSIACLPLMASMLVAMFQVQLRYGYSSVNTVGLTPNGPVFGPPGYEINLLYIVALAAIAVLGAGPLSIAAGIGRRSARRGSGGRVPAGD